ncbi:hypothetical protein LXA43DRAFT_1155924 [Ganoderma leucocontextum]|nr:hypothetical protein LXA43DRAFT_1155924 [Ganoderma leucocontextum]
MSPTTSTGSLLGVLHDSGAPTGSRDYTTLVVLHGHNWHSGTFSKVIPLAGNYNTRVILLNRRGYPGSTAFTDEELGAIPKLAHDAGEDALEEAKEELGVFMRERAREVRRGNAGGIVVAGWSFAALWMTSLMTYVSSFPVNDVELSKYVRRVVIFVRSDLYHRAFDTTLPKEERTAAYDIWERARKISSYYSHGDTLDSLSHEALADPPSTVSTLSAEERASLTHRPGGAVDSAIMMPGIQSGLLATLRQRAFLLPLGEEVGDGEDESVGDAWRDVELRVVWCQMSHAEVSYIMLLLIAELEDAKKKGAPVRNVRIVRVKRGNHFIQWDQPDMAMRALLGDEGVL